jgi:sugar phosphate isomerase/epimerase
MSKSPTRRLFLQTSLATLAGEALSPPSRLAAGEKKGPDPKRPRFPFYAMDTGLGGPDVPTLEKKVQLLKELGYAGIGYTLNHRQLPALLDLLDREGLELWAVYTVPSLEGKPDPDLGESIKRMKGRPTRIELAITSRQHKPSDPAGDAPGLELVRRVSDLAADSGPVVSIYPHRGFWTERVEDGVRIVKELKRKNVGTNFNLVHWKWLKQAKSLDALLKESLPHLFSVTINGMQGDRIVSLDRGDYDVAAFVAAVSKAGYRGPVGLQGYSVPGPSGEHLRRSMGQWREILKGLG